MAGVMIMIATLTAMMMMTPFFPALFLLLATKVPGTFNDLRRPIAKSAFVSLLPAKVPFRLADCGRLWSAGPFEMFFRALRLFR
jgi:hypothetical protein